MLYKPGDVVTIKEWDDMRMEYGIHFDGRRNVINTPLCYFTEDMRHTCGQSFVVKRVSGVYKLCGCEDYFFVDAMIAGVVQDDDISTEVNFCAL